MKKKIIRLLSLPKTIYFNIKCLKLRDAIKLPFLINYKVKISGINRDSIYLKGKIKYGMVKIGYGGSCFVSSNKPTFIIDNGKVFFENSCVLGEGCNIYIRNGVLKFKENFYSNKNLTIQCENKIKFGRDNLIGWNVSIRDTNGHAIVKDNIAKKHIGQIEFGDHIWIASEARVLRGVTISNNSVIGCFSLLSNYVSTESGELIVGIPAKKKKSNINWIN